MASWRAWLDDLGIWSDREGRREAERELRRDGLEASQLVLVGGIVSFMVLVPALMSLLARFAPWTPNGTSLVLAVLILVAVPWLCGRLARALGGFSQLLEAGLGWTLLFVAYLLLAGGSYLYLDHASPGPVPAAPAAR